MTDEQRVVDDPDVPALGLLTGATSRDVLAVLATSAGGTIRSSRIGQVRYIPGRSVTVQYDVAVEARSTTSRATFVATSVPAPGSEVVDVDGVEVSVWVYPDDPYLPGLASAADPAGVADLLESFGVSGNPTAIRRRAYRASRRAVLEAIGTAASVYLKVVRPDRVRALAGTHRTMAGVLPVPRSLGHDAALGIVALQAMPGVPLRRALEAGAEQVPSPEVLIAILDRVPAVDHKAPPGPVARFPDHRRLLTAILPELDGRLETLELALSRTPSEPRVPAHGDFHASQVLVDGSSVVGLVDVDTAGVGYRSDDYAGILAQLSTLSLMSSNRDRLDSYAASLIRAFDRLVDAGGLRLRVAAAIVGLATGPYRVQMANWPRETAARISLAARWVEAANRAR